MKIPNALVFGTAHYAHITLHAQQQQFPNDWLGGMQKNKKKNKKKKKKTHTVQRHTIFPTANTTLASPHSRHTPRLLWRETKRHKVIGPPDLFSPPLGQILAKENSFGSLGFFFVAKHGEGRREENCTRKPWCNGDTANRQNQITLTISVRFPAFRWLSLGQERDDGRVD